MERAPAKRGDVPGEVAILHRQRRTVEEGDHGAMLRSAVACECAVDDLDLRAVLRENHRAVHNAVRAEEVESHKLKGRVFSHDLEKVVIRVRRLNLQTPPGIRRVDLHVLRDIDNRRVVIDQIFAYGPLNTEGSKGTESPGWSAPASARF